MFSKSVSSSISHTLDVSIKNLAEQILVDIKKTVTAENFFSTPIHNRNEILSCLSRALASDINENVYKKMNDSDKSEISSLIANKLIEESVQYPTEYFHYDISPSNRILERHAGIGFEFSTMRIPVLDEQEYGGDGYCKRIKCLNFPAGLFLDKSRLKEHIVSAVQSQYSTILIEKERCPVDNQEYKPRRNSF